jgi:hypothetical protein
MRLECWAAAATTVSSAWSYICEASQQSGLSASKNGGADANDQSPRLGCEYYKGKASQAAAQPPSSISEPAPLIHLTSHLSAPKTHRLFVFFLHSFIDTCLCFCFFASLGGALVLGPLSDGSYILAETLKQKTASKTIATRYAGR